MIPILLKNNITKKVITRVFKCKWTGSKWPSGDDMQYPVQRDVWAFLNVSTSVYLTYMAETDTYTHSTNWGHQLMSSNVPTLIEQCQWGSVTSNKLQFSLPRYHMRLLFHYEPLPADTETHIKSTKRHTYTFLEIQIFLQLLYRNSIT